MNVFEIIFKLEVSDKAVAVKMIPTGAFERGYRVNVIAIGRPCDGIIFISLLENRKHSQGLARGVELALLVEAGSRPESLCAITGNISEEAHILGHLNIKVRAEVVATIVGVAHRALLVKKTERNEIVDIFRAT